MTHSPGDDLASELAGVAERLGSRLVEAHPVGWGDSAATYRLTLANGEEIAARRLAGPDGLESAHRSAAVMTRLAEAGLPAPETTVRDVGDAAWLTTSWIAGETGAAWLGEPDRARALGSVMGDVARRLREVDVTGVPLHGGAATSQALAADAGPWLDGVHGEIGLAAYDALQKSIGWLATADRWTPGFVHGDFAPINVILGPRGDLRAILDVEHARLGSSLADVAWWGWVVRHHHPAAWEAAWTTFRVEAGATSLEPEAIRALILSRLLESVARADLPVARSRWLARLDEAASAW